MTVIFFGIFTAGLQSLMVVLILCVFPLDLTLRQRCCFLPHINVRGSTNSHLSPMTEMGHRLFISYPSLRIIRECDDLSILTGIFHDGGRDIMILSVQPAVTPADNTIHTQHTQSSGNKSQNAFICCSLWLLQQYSDHGG